MGMWRSSGSSHFIRPILFVSFRSEVPYGSRTSMAEVHTRMNENPRSHKGFRGFSFSVTANSYATGVFSGIERKSPSPVRFQGRACCWTGYKALSWSSSKARC